MSEAQESIARLARRVALLPQLITQTLELPAPVAPSRLCDGAIVITGAGIAAGPARYLAACLRHELGLAARYCPPSAFALAGSRPQADSLVVFSQGLSANARTVLSHFESYEHVTLFTAVEPNPTGTDAERRVASLSDAGVQLVHHGPKREAGMLVRVLGSTASMLQSVRWARSLGGTPDPAGVLTLLPAAVAAALKRATEIAATCPPTRLLGNVAFVTVGGYGDACRGLAWKWMEELWTSEPSRWDVLQVAHGPLQTFWEREMTLIALCGPRDPAKPLFDRLDRVLHPDRHLLLRLGASAPGALAVFEHGAALDQLMVSALEASPRDLSQWPAKGVDEPLYGLSEPLDQSTTSRSA